MVKRSVKRSLTPDAWALVKMGLLGLYSDKTYITDAVDNWLRLHGYKTGEKDRDKRLEVEDLLWPSGDLESAVEDIQLEAKGLLDRLSSAHSSGRRRRSKIWSVRVRRNRVKEILQNFDKGLDQLRELCAES